jgi:para-aminobenzoate synthetase/4-amino-4-deoxychorismate lyase
MAAGEAASSEALSLEPPFVLMEDRLAGRGRIYRRPVELVRCGDPEGLEDAFARLEAGLARGLHAAGVLAYELGYALEPRLAPLMPSARADPLLQLGLFPPPLEVSGAALDALFAALGPPPPLSDVRPGHDRATHAAKVRRVLDLIGAGDIYQANLTFPLTFGYDGDPLRLYAALRVRQPTAHGGVVALGEAWTLSVSPELFLRGANGRLESRPMKGTVARGGDATEDRAAVRALVSDPKQRAENIMIVDLIRNDLARIARPGSVRAPNLLTVETYPDLHTLTSTVVAQIRPGIGLRERLAAVFPCGSIVGAPKIRAAQVLRALEAGARGVYTGALGAFGPDGDLALSVAIRTVQLRGDGSGVYGVGGGVVADSDPDAEYDEARLKGRIIEDLAEDFGLIETLRWSPVHGFIRLERHLARLAHSATALGFAFDLAAAHADLAARAQAWSSGGDWRVRLSLSRSGRLDVAGAPAARVQEGPARIGLASVRLDAGDPYLRHKTTRRRAYDAAARETLATGYDEALLLNLGGQVADASRHSVFASLDGRLVTPPLAAGALAGVLRAALIDDGRAVEGDLTLDRLQAADALYIGNSLNGLRRAGLVIPSPLKRD